MKDDETRIPVIVTLPQVSETMKDGQVRFLKRPGEAVRRDEAVLEVDTDKVTIELTAPADGVLVRTRGDGDARVGDELYALQPGAAPPPPTVAPPKPAAPRPPEAVKVPVVLMLQTTWNAGPLRARAHAERPALVDPLHHEAALLWTAVARALVAVPVVSASLIDPRSRRMMLRHCDVLPDGVRWLHGAVGPGDASATVLSNLRPGPGDAALLQIVRLHTSSPLVTWPQLPPRGGLSLVLGPVLDAPVVEGGAVVIRPMGSLSVSLQPPLAADEACRLVAALAEQLAT